MDTDEEIEKIMNEISIKDVRSFKDIQNFNKLALDSVYSGFLKYDINKENYNKVC